MIETWLPFPPSNNNLFSQTKSGRRFPSKKYLMWRKQAELLLILRRLEPVEGPCLIEIELTPPDKRRRDADNGTKAIVDSLVRMRLIPDDNRGVVREVRVRWAEGRPPGAVVRVSALTEEKQAA